MRLIRQGRKVDKKVSDFFVGVAISRNGHHLTNLQVVNFCFVQKSVLCSGSQLGRVNSFKVSKYLYLNGLPSEFKIGLWLIKMAQSWSIASNLVVLNPVQSNQGSIIITKTLLNNSKLVKSQHLGGSYLKYSI